MGSTGPTTSHGSIQIWSGPASVTSGESRWRLDLVIKLDSCPLAARWRPRPIGPVVRILSRSRGRLADSRTKWTSPLSGDALACLGHLAVATADGQITFYAVPDPSTIGVDRDPDSPHRTGTHRRLASAPTNPDIRTQSLCNPQQQSLSGRFGATHSSGAARTSLHVV